MLVGGDFKKADQPYLYFENSVQAKEWFRDQKIVGTNILIKGSRSTQMEKVLE